MPRDSGPDLIGRTVEGHKHESGMAQDGFDRRGERPEDKPVAAAEQRRRRPIFRADPPVAGAEDNRGKPADVIGAERRAPGEAELDRCRRRQMDAGKAGGNGRRVIGDHEIARPQQPDKGRAPSMGDASLRIDGQKLGVLRTLDRFAGGKHPHLP